MLAEDVITTTIREATPADVGALLAMGEDFLSQTAYGARYPYNAAHLLTLAHDLIAQPRSVILLAERERPVGMLGLVVTSHFLSGQTIAGEVFYWMAPFARGRAGVRLLRAGEAWARAKGAIRLQMIAPSDRVGALYLRQGYLPVERIYEKDL